MRQTTLCQALKNLERSWYSVYREKMEKLETEEFLRFLLVMQKFMQGIVIICTILLHGT